MKITRSRPLFCGLAPPIGGMLWKMTELYFEINNPWHFSRFASKVVLLVVMFRVFMRQQSQERRGSVVKWKVCFKIVYLDVFTCIWGKWIRGNLLSWVILDETSATKLSWAAIERENGFCQAPLLAPFNYQQLMETSKTWGKIDDRVKRKKRKNIQFKRKQS